jgi:acyl-CoA synthetase (AMP-forming)/AMP-acid ligase II
LRPSFTPHAEQTCEVGSNRPVLANVRWCRAALYAFQAPKVIHVAEEVPRTPLGKIDRQALRRRYGAGGPAGP